MKYLSDLLCYGINLLLCCSVVTARTLQNCPHPDVPADGKYEPEMKEFLQGSTVVYSCNDGFLLEGGSISECQFDGTWSEMTPFCDHEKTFKIRRGLMGDYDITESSKLDGTTKTCHFVNHGESVQLELEKEVVVRGVKIYLSNGFEDIDIYSGLGNKTTLWPRHKVDLWARFTRGWFEIKSGTHGVLADKIEIRKEWKDGGRVKISSLLICDIRVLGFGRQFDYGCTFPPEITVANGYFKVNRTKAILICEDGYISENDGLDCGINSWKGLSPRCAKANI